VIHTSFTRREYQASAIAAAQTITIVFLLLPIAFFWAFAEGDGASAPRGMSLAGWIVGILGFPITVIPLRILRAVEHELPRTYLFVFAAAIAVFWGLVAAGVSLLRANRSATGERSAALKAK
jgi:hypothetical protein